LRTWADRSKVSKQGRAGRSAGAAAALGLDAVSHREFGNEAAGNHGAQSRAVARTERWSRTPGARAAQNRTVRARARPCESSRGQRGAGVQQGSSERSKSVSRRCPRMNTEPETAADEGKRDARVWRPLSLGSYMQGG
jgi:hypothetical protein